MERKNCFSLTYPGKSDKKPGNAALHSLHTQKGTKHSKLTALKIQLRKLSNKVQKAGTEKSKSAETDTG